MFKSAYLKLTIYYVVIVMLLSISFSLIIYRLSYNELNQRLGHGMRSIELQPQPGFNQPPNQNIEDIIKKELGSSEIALRNQLIYLNILIAIVSSFGCYFLAKMTLKPVAEMVESQNRFTADASHELKTPLAAMKTEIEVGLRDKNFNFNESKKILNSNLEEINKLEFLANTLLSLARYQEQIKVDFKKVSLQDVIVEAYEKLEKKSKDKQIIFKNKLEEITINGNRQSLVELFIILIDNAIKYSKDKSEISINLSKENNKAVVRIEDYGIGIKACDLPYIFNRFYRADQSRNKDKISGYGLGLSIAKEIVELHKGEIKVNSIIGKGTKFTILFKV
jgi:signal transduction histidine kinase